MASNHSLDAYRTEREAQLKQKQQSARQAADITHQKLLKYLPQRTKGFSDGMTETAKIAANNAYMRQLAEADNTFSTEMSELNNYVRGEQERLEDKEKAAQTERYNEIMTTVRNGEYNTVADLERYLGITADGTGAKSFGEGSIAEGLSDTQKANLLNLYRTIETDPVQAENESEFKQKQNKIATGDAKWLDDDAGFLGLSKASAEGDNIEVQIPGADNEDLNVQYKKSITGRDKAVVEQAFKSANGREIKEGEVFAYDGEIYIMSHNRLWTLEARGGGGGGDYAELYRHYYPDQG